MGVGAAAAEVEPPCVPPRDSAFVYTRVVDSTGAPIPEAGVRVGDYYTSHPDSAGWSCLRELPRDGVRVIAERIGFHAETKTVTLRPGRTDTLTFTLRRAPPPCC